jgi:hypothetical protein
MRKRALLLRYGHGDMMRTVRLLTAASILTVNRSTIVHSTVRQALSLSLTLALASLEIVSRFVHATPSR